MERAADRGPRERRAALRDGVDRTWGQLRIPIRLDDRGRRRYEVRHVADAGVLLEALRVHDDPAAALDIACCVDGECRKRRAWDEDSGRAGALDVPRGAGEFPCREPCSLVVAAAREFVRTERAPQKRGSSLRPREVAQLRRVVDVVADGQVEDVERGDLTDPANRLRVRYLRERLRDRGLPLATGSNGSRT